ncbi:MAG: hypothetical protein ACI971_000807, partial [Colwellia sp.]
GVVLLSVTIFSSTITRSISIANFFCVAMAV